MANVRFIKGTESGILNKTNYDVNYDGAFLLATDTNRLYTVKNINATGTANYKPVPVNQGITIVSTVSGLPPITAEILGQFYYVSSTNILCIAGQTGNGESNWIQVNSYTDDYALESVTKTIETITNGVSITIGGENKKFDGTSFSGEGHSAEAATINIKSSGGISVGKQGDDIVISGAGLNAMTYQGTIDSLEDLPNDADLGYTYYVGEGFTSGSISYKQGDLFIRNQNTTGNILDLYDYVPAGDEIMPNYSVDRSGKTFAIKKDTANLGSLTFGNMFDTSSSGTDMTINLAWETLS